MSDTLRRPLPSAALPLDLAGLREETQMSIDAGKSLWAGGYIGLYGYSPSVVMALLDRIEELERQLADAIPLDAFKLAENVLTADDDYMCPNCVTPWKCNGPHELPTKPRTTQKGGQE